MNKIAMVCLAAAMTLGSGAAMAAGGNNGTSNQAADAGAVAPGAKENLPPNNVDNSKINNGSGTSHSSSTHSSKHMTADEIDQNAQCKDGKCPNINRKVETKVGGGEVNTKTDGTTQ
ncbi:YbgS-like family protein [Duffyella gerundensis]|uniref:YbgS-like family protein n=1 Tax=Duffyella TaxID=3026546 RepID=UPI003F6DD130